MIANHAMRVKAAVCIYVVGAYGARLQEFEQDELDRVMAKLLEAEGRDPVTGLVALLESRESLNGGIYENFGSFNRFTSKHFTFGRKEVSVFFLSGAFTGSKSPRRWGRDG
ncbi:MAG: hypothetical protein R3F11_29450 [Verrucomicrobiales bacterium]